MKLIMKGVLIMKLTVFVLLILAVTGFAAERVVTWEYFTQTG